MASSAQIDLFSPLTDAPLSSGLYRRTARPSGRSGIGLVHLRRILAVLAALALLASAALLPDAAARPNGPRAWQTDPDLAR